MRNHQRESAECIGGAGNAEVSGVADRRITRKRAQASKSTRPASAVFFEPPPIDLVVGEEYDSGAGGWASPLARTCSTMFGSMRFSDNLASSYGGAVHFDADLPCTAHVRR